MLQLALAQWILIHFIFSPLCYFCSVQQTLLSICHRAGIVLGAEHKAVRNGPFTWGALDTMWKAGHRETVSTSSIYAVTEVSQPTMCGERWGALPILQVGNAGQAGFPE